ncbi:MAG: 50S ribosomal protein L24 [Candidatus Micrarchaeota archaeon]
MAKCSFCGKQIAMGTGFSLFKKTGETLNYCSRKCRRNQALKRNPRKFKWASGA